MRQKRIKDVEEKIENYSSWLVDEPKEYKGKWHSVFGNNKPIYLEIGCGKGQFIITNAKERPECNFIAVEGNPSAAYRALQRTEELEEGNLKFIRTYINDIRDIFEKGEIEGLYLNFSDPWPKARHEKRRLTCGKNLTAYGDVVKDGGFLQFKTDNEGLFQFTVDEIERLGFKVEGFSRDLHNSPYAEGNIMTEYEEKFSGQGKNINFIKIKYE